MLWKDFECFRKFGHWDLKQYCSTVDICQKNNNNPLLSISESGNTSLWNLTTALGKNSTMMVCCLKDNFLNFINIWSNDKSSQTISSSNEVIWAFQDIMKIFRAISASGKCLLLWINERVLSSFPDPKCLRSRYFQ